MDTGSVVMGGLGILGEIMCLFPSQILIIVFDESGLRPAVGIFGHELRKIPVMKRQLVMVV